jgi:hypothetical protein
LQIRGKLIVFFIFEPDYSLTLVRMKKILIVAGLIIITVFPGIAQLTHLGLEAAFASEVKEPGFGLNAIYRVNDQIKLTPKALYFLSHTVNTANGADILEGTQKFEWWMINLDGNYVLINQGPIEGYGIMGLNFANVNWERNEVVLGQTEEERRQVLKLGLNIGAGIRFNLGEKVVPFGELRYTIGGKADWLVTEVSTSQFSIAAGVMFRINEDKDRSNTDDY